MAITKEKKKEIISKLSKAFKESTSVVFVHFKGLKVNVANKFRRKLSIEKVGYTVARKTLISRALDESKFAGDKPALDGEVSIAYSMDLLAAPREVQTFAKENKGIMTIIGGIVEGKYEGKDKMLELASIPPMNTLRAQFVNLINSPLQRF